MPSAESRSNANKATAMMSTRAIQRRNQTILSSRPCCRAVVGDACRLETRRPSRKNPSSPPSACLLYRPDSAPRCAFLPESSRSRTFHLLRWIACVLLAIATANCVASGEAAPTRQQPGADQPRPQTQATRSTHASNHAVIVSSSRYWFNYRHVINALSIYQLLRRNGISDDQIVLMLADEYATNPRNPLPNQMLASGRAGPTLYDGTVQVDYRGDDVRVESFLNVLTGRRRHSCAEDDIDDYNVDDDCEYTYGPVLDSDRDSNVLIYLTGHGGDNFFKFQDAEEVLAAQLGAALDLMHAHDMYRHVLVVADTCQAFTLGDAVTAPNVTVIGSSLRGESSYAHHSDDVLGLSVIERYTHALSEFVRGKDLGDLTLRQGLVDPYPYESQRAHVGIKEDTSQLTIDQLRMSDFFVDAGASAPDPDTVRLLPDDDPVRFVPPFPTSPIEDELTGEAERRRQDAPQTDERPGPGDPSAAEPRRWTVHLGRTSASFLPRTGLEPTDPLFVAMVTVLLGSVAWASASTRYV